MNSGAFRMKRLLSRLFGFVALQLRLRKPRVAWAIYRAHGDRDHYCRMNGEVILRGTTLEVNAANAPLLAISAPMIRRLASSVHAQWAHVPDLKLRARIENLSFELTTWEDIFVVMEIFDSGVYAIAHPARCIVIDVGANIGISSLFFASKPWVEHVFSFEPFKHTAGIARFNFDLNPEFATRSPCLITALAPNTRRWPFSIRLSGKPTSVVMGSPKIFQETSNPGLSRSSSAMRPSAFSKSSTQVPALPLIVKMDCEGAEWEILPKLKESGVLNRVTHLLLEWHFETPEPIERILLDSGFSVIRRSTPGSSPLGLLYATRVAQPV